MLHRTQCITESHWNWDYSRGIIINTLVFTKWAWRHWAPSQPIVWLFSDIVIIVEESNNPNGEREGKKGEVSTESNKEEIPNRLEMNQRSVHWDELSKSSANLENGCYTTTEWGSDPNQAKINRNCLELSLLVYEPCKLFATRFI